MHQSVRDWVELNSDGLIGPTLDIGSCDVNGTVRDLMPKPYTGIDIVEGPNVGLVYDGRRVPFGNLRFGTVICLEVFEHCEDPVHLASEIVRVLARGGAALISARGPGFPHHHPPDRWRFMPGTLLELFTRHGDVWGAEMQDPQDGHPGSFVRIARW